MPNMIYTILIVLACGLVIGAAMFVQRLGRERERNDEFSSRLAVELQLASAKAGPMRQREFRIAFAQQRDAAAAAGAARRNAYRVTVRHDESRDRWVVHASRRMTDHAADATGTYFEQIASRHSGDYEGATVVTEQEKAPSSSES